MNASASVSAGGGDGDGPNGRDTNRLRSPIAVRPNSPFTTVDSEDLFIDSEISSSSSSPDGEGGGTQEDDVRMRKEEENEETVRNWGWDDIRAIWGNNKNVNSTSTGVNVRGKEEEDQDGRRSALPMMVLPKVSDFVVWCTCRGTDLDLYGSFEKTRMSVPFWFSYFVFILLTCCAVAHCCGRFIFSSSPFVVSFSFSFSFFFFSTGALLRRTKF